jgi:hypothetical protein
MRAVVIRESLSQGALPCEVGTRHIDRYPHMLDGEIGIEILEFDVDETELLSVLHGLASALLEPGYYAHVWSPDELYICFPSTIAFVMRGKAGTLERAKRIGDAFGIPRSQMRFEEMFETHHPDANWEQT